MMKEDDRPVRERIRSRLKRESMEDSGTSFQFDDTGIDDIYTDSRKKMANGLFVPIVGEHSDGHDYIEMAIKNGAVAVLSSRPVSLRTFLPGKKYRGRPAGDRQDGTC